MSEQVKKMFSGIAVKYDLFNTILSFGIHHRWRAKVVKIAKQQNISSILDCACGTGDLAIEFKRKLPDNALVSGVDFCKEMLDIAKIKVKKKQLEIDFSESDILDLPIPDNSYDVSTIAFGIRNVDSTEKCLVEMARVVKPDGLVIVLEFGQPKGLLSIIYKFYSKYIIPFVGKMLAQSPEAYLYLPETASRYPCRNDFLNIMKNTERFENYYYKTLSSGIAFIYVGKVK